MEQNKQLEKYFEGSSPVCVFGEVNSNIEPKCDKCGAEFCTKCGGVKNRPSQNVLPCECALNI